MDLVEEYNEKADDGECIYLTLPGETATDLYLLEQRGILTYTENGQVTASSQRKILGLESSPNSYYEIKRKFPGLSLLKQNISDFLHGEDRTNFPQGDAKKKCRARVINLDLNTKFNPIVQGDDVYFPALRWIEKFAAIQAISPKREWCLLLTLHGEISWSQELATVLSHILSTNCATSDTFCDSFYSLFQDHAQAILAGDQSIFDLATIEQQKLLLILIPKRLCMLLQNEPWELNPEFSLWYGGGEHAPMVTWAIRFHPSFNYAAGSPELYRRNLNTLFGALGHVDGDGTLYWSGEMPE